MSIPISLHTSMIDGIRVYQVGGTEINSSNKKDQKADVNKGKNKGVDLGKGVQNIRITIKVNEKNDFDALYKILSEVRKCTLTDRFLGVVKVSITSYNILHTDKELGLSTIKIAMTVDEKFNPSVNYSGQMDKAKSEISKSAKGDYVGAV